ncbi:MAG: type II toxin-antitoxin system prevent-host-death family antitoxin [Gammaproteobacteria bacterium]|nr:type II toxin-antitoxin system prevent-host-death family antitoxin [Gammaproteobacteria bacterium]MCY4344974.1 type II toxin-antitoxin system prevent-host-death family antitoxin [Gammaproteobacteria bacterium]
MSISSAEYGASKSMSQLIAGKRGRAALVCEDDWKAVQETLRLLSIPGMRESIQEGMEALVEDCSEALDW